MMAWLLCAIFRSCLVWACKASALLTRSVVARERARAIGAEVDWLSSRFSSGTRFELRLPVAALIDTESDRKEG